MDNAGRRNPGRGTDEFRDSGAGELVSALLGDSGKQTPAPFLTRPGRSIDASSALSLRAMQATLLYQSKSAETESTARIAARDTCLSAVETDVLRILRRTNIYGALERHA
jgi:hypothetical protein